MKILKFIWLMPSLIIIFFYIIYVIAKVIKETGIVELELMGTEQVSDAIYDDIITPFMKDKETPFKVFSTLIWITILIS